MVGCLNGRRFPPKCGSKVTELQVCKSMKNDKESMENIDVSKTINNAVLPSWPKVFAHLHIKNLKMPIKLVEIDKIIGV